MTAGAPPEISRLQAIRTFSELVEYLRDELDWPISETTQEDEAFFDYDAAEVGLDEASAVKIERIRRLRPLVAGQPWGIFFIDFRPGKLPITVLRRILRALVVKKRAGNDKQRWQMGDLLFISILGETGHRGINLAHFSDDGSGDGRAALRVVDWDEDDAHFHMLRTVDELHCLRWPQNGADPKMWRETWSAAFRLKPGQVAKTAAQLATQMAALAKLIRARVNAAMAIESAKGPLSRMYEAFKQVLISDLTKDAFADMYAQTITYGLFAARRSRPMGVTAETARDMVPNTNPFLRDLLAEFTDVGGATKSLDFDELGIDALVEVLNQADMEAVVADFDDKNPDEDPVIHFYVDFLHQYDKKMKVQRGIFFTPRPVVSFIVRSVDELLRTEFGLKDGLADTTTWGEMMKRNSGLSRPAGATPETPFVQILDPAVGTGTFLVEVIDVIHRTMMAKWQREGHLPMLDIPELWNDYVANHLLPRLYGFELMMAPYAIAHMKIGLKLSATGYRFADEERLRIFLTNTLEEPRDIGTQFEGMAPALAHEAAAANEVKRNSPITVIMGNPPYSGISANMNPWIEGLLKGRLPNGTKTESYYELDGKPLGEKKLWLQDDYVKFIRFSHFLIERSSVGIHAMITNHSYLDSPTCRGMRFQMLKFFSVLNFVDLHGSTKRGESHPDGDQNVFDILPGVAIAICARSGHPVEGRVRSYDLWGTRATKSAWLLKHQVQDVDWIDLAAVDPYYLFVKREMDYEGEYLAYYSLKEIFPFYGTGIQTSRDDFATDLNRSSLKGRLRQFFDLRRSDDEVSDTFGLSDTRGWKIKTVRRASNFEKVQRTIAQFLFRPFDRRWLPLTKDIVDWPRLEVMSCVGPDHLGLMCSRQQSTSGFRHALMVNAPADMFCLSNKSREGQTMFPLFVHSGRGLLKAGNEPSWQPNLAARFEVSLSELLSPEIAEADRMPITNSQAQEAANYVYTILHSQAYRNRYVDLLKMDYPRIPLTRFVDLFRALAGLGGEIVDLHLMEAPQLSQHITTYVGPTNPEVEKLSYDRKTVWLDKAQRRGFSGVPEDVWNFHIGGYQVCEKWLKDRKGRTLSDEDIAHYQKIVVALHETIRIMAEIDEVIEKHGGWPGAFQAKGPETKEPEGNA